jgi:hypothetical protein
MGTLIGIIYIILALGVLLFFIKRKRPKGKTIAGPKDLPVLGCIFEIDNETIHFKFSEWAEKFGDIFRFKMLSENVVVLNTEENIRKAFGSEKYKHHFGDRAETFFWRALPVPKSIVSLCFRWIWTFSSYSQEKLHASFTYLYLYIPYIPMEADFKSWKITS